MARPLTTWQVAFPLSLRDNPYVSNTKPAENSAGAAGPFHAGTIVVATLGNPREKLWGSLLALSAEGLSLCGIELASFDDLVAMVKDSEPFTPSVVFFPMHRVERIELDLPDGSIPSLSQRFTAKTGRTPADVLKAADMANSPAAEERR